VRTIAGFLVPPSRAGCHHLSKASYKYTENFLHMLSPTCTKTTSCGPRLVRALDTIFILHADHEQNCSTSTVRMVASAQANLFASAAAGVCALWGPLHGGANQWVIEMLADIHRAATTVRDSSRQPRTRTAASVSWASATGCNRNYDPRARINQRHCDTLLRR